MNHIQRWAENTLSGYDTKVTSSSFSSSRPSLIRTTNSFDGNDETFSFVALNLLSRCEYFGLTPSDAIHATLVTPRERLSFLEALSVRKMQAHQAHHHLSPSTVSLIETVDTRFGKDLVRIVETEDSMAHMKPACELSAHTLDSSIETKNGTAAMHGQQPQVGTFHIHPPQRRCADQRRENRTRAFFFPDSSAIWGSRTRGKMTTRNIDWKLAEAIEQVTSLRLDGIDMSPPTTTKASTSSLGYEPPCVEINPSFQSHGQTNNVVPLSYCSFQ